MVKIDSTIGMKLKGKIGDFIIQDVNGQQVLRKGYKENKSPTAQQLEVRSRFKNAVNWVKNLSVEEKNHIKQYFRQVYPYYEKGQPANWYNFAKNFVLTVPSIEIIDETTRTYQIKHPGILSISHHDTFGNCLQSFENLSNLNNLKFTNTFVLTLYPTTALIKVITISGDSYEFKFNPVTIELIYCDIRYCNPLYCK